MNLVTLLLSCFAFNAYCQCARAHVPSELFSPLIPQKAKATFDQISLKNPVLFPQTTNTSGLWQYSTPNSWGSGFFPGILYLLHQRSVLCPANPANGLGIADWLSLGRVSTTGLIPAEPENSPDHDRAFLLSFFDELSMNPGNETAQAVVIDFANILGKRFNPYVGCTRSWDGWDGSEPYKVLIDTMMTLESLVLAANFTGNSTFYDMAVSHADTVMKNQIREDGSTWQIVGYNSTSGGVVDKWSPSAYSNDSTWSRGQAWGIQGFANMFRLTGHKRYLETARRLAIYFIDHIPEDGIVPWDFEAPLVPAPRAADSSAAMIAASAFLLLARLEVDAVLADHLTKSAIRIVNATSSFAWRPSWQSILSNATVNYPKGIVFTGLVYGDYYYIKIGNELISRGMVECL